MEQQSNDEMKMLNQICDAFVVGSDQLWNPSLIKYSGKQYFLSFVDREKNKVAYGTSLGDTHSCNDDFIKKYKVYLKRFNNRKINNESLKKISGLVKSL